MKLTPPQHRRLVAAGLVGLWAAWFAPQLLSSGIPFRRDTLLLYLPIRTFLHDQLRAFQLPQWFPYEGLGVPFIGQFVTATFHPETWLLLPFSPAMALKLNILGAYLFALVGGYRFARALSLERIPAACGGASLAFGGYALSMSDNLPYLVGLATMPWVGWAALRLVHHRRARDIALLGLVWGLLLLSGDVQSFLLSGALVATCLIAGRAPFVAWAQGAVSAAIGLGVGAIELLPASSVFGSSTRLNSGLVIDPATYWALPIRRLPELFVPHYLPDAWRVQSREMLYGESFQWATTIFIGGIVLLLALTGVATRRRGSVAFLLLSAGALWMATGGAGHLLPLVWKVLPPLASFRFPEKYVGLCCVGLVPLVSLGAASFLADRARATFWALSFAFFLLLLSFTVRADRMVERLAESALKPVLIPEELAEQIAWGWGSGLRTTAACLAVLGFALWFLRKWSWGALVLPLMIAGELWLGNSTALPLAPRALLDPPVSPFAEVLKPSPIAGPIRIVSTARTRPGESDDPVVPDHWVQGSLSLLKPDVAALFGSSTLGASALPGQSERTRAVLGKQGVRTAQLAGVFGVCHGVVDEATPLPPTFKVLAHDAELGLALVRAEHCRSTAYFADVKPAGEMDKIASTLPELRDEQALWEGPATTLPLAFDVAWKAWAPGRLKLASQASDPAALIVSEGFAEGWRATIDGAPQLVVPANGIALGLQVPAGEHTIDLTYETPRLKLGAAITLLSLLVAAWLLSRRSSAPS